MSFPAIEELVPHAGPMCLLDRVLRHDEEETACAVRPEASGALALGDGRLPASVALEWMAQCIAVDGGLRARAHGVPPRPGLFLGARRASLPGDAFDPDGELVVVARRVRGSGRGAHAFACRLEAPGAGALAEGTLQVMIAEDLASLSGGSGPWR